MISSYSVVAGILWLSLALIMIALLRTRTGFMLRYSAELLLFAALLALVRTLLPLDLKQAYIIRSFSVMPLATDAMETTLPDGIPVGQSLLLIWAGGSVVTLLCEIYAVVHDWSERKCYRVISTRWAERAAHRAQIPPEMVVVTPDLPQPVTLGIFHPKIYLPLMPMTDSELDWIIRHELQHIKGRDMWLKLLYYPVLAALWWNPVVWYFSHELTAILEMRCDQKVVRGRSAEERTEYGEMLLRFAKLKNQQKNYAFSSMMFTMPAKKDVLVQRTELILGEPPRHRTSTVAAACVCVAIFIASYFVLLQPYGEPAEEDVIGEISFAENEEYSLVHKADGNYELWCGGNYICDFYGNCLDEEPFCDMEIIEESRGEEQ